MPKAKGTTTNSPKKRMRPAISPEAREAQLIALAMDAAEEQLMNGTASSQVITHFLKLGTENASLEREKLRHETEMVKAKTAQLESQKRVEELYADAIAAMKNYSGNGDPDEYEDY
jgi:hypothetical protein